MHRIPYGRGTMRFSLPPSLPVPPVSRQKEAVNPAHPAGTPPLRKLARPGGRVGIVFADSMRSCPDRLLIPPILSELKTAGVRDEDVTLLCGTGMHRPSTRVLNLGMMFEESAAPKEKGLWPKLST